MDRPTGDSQVLWISPVGPRVFYPWRFSCPMPLGRAPMIMLTKSCRNGAWNQYWGCENRNNLYGMILKKHGNVMAINGRIRATNIDRAMSWCWWVAGWKMSLTKVYIGYFQDLQSGAPPDVSISLIHLPSLINLVGEYSRHIYISSLEWWLVGSKLGNHPQDSLVSG